MTEPSTALKTKSRAQKSRIVSGKKKSDAPKAVIECESNRQKLQPAKISKTMRNIDNLLDSVQQKIEKITIYEDASENTDTNPNHDRAITECPREIFAQPLSPKYQRLAEVRVSNNKTERHDIHPGPPSKERNQRSGGKNSDKPDDGIQESYFVEDKRTLSYVQPILNEALSSTCRQGVQRFDKWADRAGDAFTVKKIAEGSYGEVYQLCIKNDISRGTFSKSRLARLKAYRDGVFKIVPLRAERGVGSKKFTTIQEIVAESQLLKLLDPIPGFARFREIHVVQGRYPTLYQAAWDEYSQTMDDCFNPDPSKKKSYPDTQLWAILEMENAGSELEKYKFSSIYQMYDVFWGVAMALARAEQFACFEHRDLHLGNVCVKTRRSSNTKSEDASHKGSSACFGISGLETTIIDYSLSRADLEIQDTDCDLEDIAWSNLDNKQIFDAIGRDEDEKLLRDTYRLMRTEVYSDDDPFDQPQQMTSDERWRSYSPRTNLVWLSFILTMLLKTCQSNNILPARRQPLAPRSANQTTKAQSPKKNKPSLESCRSDKVSNEQITNHSNPELEYELYERLQSVQDLLEFDDDECENLTSAGDLVATAIGYQWLADSDFLC